MALDEFESKHMDPHGRVLLRDKQVAGTGMRTMAIIFPGVFLIAAIGLAIGGALAPVSTAEGLLVGSAAMAVMAGLFGFMFAMMLSLRTAVTDRELLLRCGLWGPRIKVENIKSCRVAKQTNQIRVGGKRYQGGMWTTDFLMRTGEYVEVIWADESGKERRLRFTPQDPQRVAKAIEQARSSLATGLRIADSGSDIVYPEEEELEASSHARSEK